MAESLLFVFNFQKLIFSLVSNPLRLIQYPTIQYDTDKYGMIPYSLVWYD